MSLLNYFPFDQLPLSFLMLGLRALFVLTFKSFIINKLKTVFFYFCITLNLYLGIDILQMSLIIRLSFYLS